ncbi:MAG: hypothetical protein CMO07_12325 [Thalassospira sp.]|nr:hypothetical protein AUQ41_01655 [Thalassospira sp. MCCC 1A02898]MBE71479.1 hypothetical protein [Thalassospira sp.]ONH89441.1 hypothetical protein TH47_05070 [Thalassospira sp. MCCC 1A02803]HAI32287.1 hypothetical protein [Thalassospira sp.]
MQICDLGEFQAQTTAALIALFILMVPKTLFIIRDKSLSTAIKMKIGITSWRLLKRVNALPLNLGICY